MAGLFTSPGRRWHLASWRGDQDDFQSIIGSKRQYFPLASFSGASACKTGSERRTIKARDPERPCGLREACRVLPPGPLHLRGLLHLTIVLAAAPARIDRLRVPAALEKEAEAVVALDAGARNANIGRRPARHEAALGLVVQHRDELGAIIGLAAQWLVRDDDRGSWQCGRRDAVEHILRDGDA